ncbi:hypothetical protein GYMLUDRAFT_356918 [Collybiopsis luxurians FD-317 M1]|nr:hypothetical protein GYMLUDRAFT_356918 [Collybiopsis luxurians FD-317 M1]
MRTVAATDDRSLLRSTRNRLCLMVPYQYSSWSIGGNEVGDVVETIIKKTWKEIENMDLPSNLPVMTYNEAMNCFRSDKSDVLGLIASCWLTISIFFRHPDN